MAERPTPADGVGGELHREVSATADEFVRGLRAAFPDLKEDGRHFCAGAGAVTLDIAIEPGPPRRIALLVLPTLYVRLNFSGGDATARSALLAHLDRHLHRGGG